MRIRASAFAGTVSLFGFLAAAQGRDLAVTQPVCEQAREPRAVDVANPRLSWKLESSARSQRQTAYQILAASRPELLQPGKADLWDSGRGASDETTGIPYVGGALNSFQRVYWKARAWDAAENPSSWSKTGSWTMGVLNQGDWRSEWIGAPESLAPAPQTLMLRREFAARPHLRRALATVCGLGCYELTINGRKAGDALFPPGWTKYSETCLYDSYDVTGLVRNGGNAVGILLANGMYNVVGGRFTKFKGSFGPLKAIGQLRLEYADGSVETIGTDGRWRVAPGPITFSCVYGGEDFDPRLDPRGWNRAGFEDSKWQAARVMPGPGGRLRGLSCAAPPVRAFETLKPVGITNLRSGVAVYDLGHNAALMPRLVVRGSAGGSVRIIPAELLGKDGAVDRGSCAGGKPGYWQYTLAGKGGEEWFPKFFYQGCRYLQVELKPGADGTLPVVKSLSGVVVHADSPPAGRFECSNDLFNRIRRLVRWAQRSNMMSVMTDCPHREKLGWLEEDHLNGPALRYEFDLSRMSRKILNDMADSQTAEGLVPDIAPEYIKFGGGFRDSPEWGSAMLLVPWQQYEFSGDVSLLRAYYERMRRYVDYLGARATNGIVSHGLGDWYDLGPKGPGVAQLTPVPLTATAFYYCDAAILARTARLLGKPDDALRYDELAASIRSAFNARFFNPSSKSYATGSQCANAIALAMGLAEPANRPAVLEAIVRDVRARGNALTAGDVGYRYLLRALADGGRSDVIFDMNNQSDKPGYGYQLSHGATSLTEAWNARRGSSQNHFMLGQITEWFYHDLAGIQTDPEIPGFKKIVIKPAPVGDVSEVRAWYESARGLIGCHWKRRPDRFTLEIGIPANTRAEVWLPAGRVLEGGRPVLTRPGIRSVRESAAGAVVEIESGRYFFEIR